MQNKVFNSDLRYDNVPVPFVIQTLEDVSRAMGAITDSPHGHNYYTIVWPYDATGKHIIDFREFEITNQQVFFVSPGQVHQVITDPNPEGIMIDFTPEFLQRNSIQEDFISNLKLFRDSNDTPPLPVNEKMKVNLMQFVSGMLDAFYSKSEMKFETIGAYLKLFLIECNGHCTLPAQNNSQNIEVGRSLLKRFKTLVEKHYYEWHQVKNYAEALNITPNYLNEVIKSTINITAKEYIQNRLILEAKRKSLFTDKSSKEIGFDLGFDDPSHFSKFYKSITGQSLLEFKEFLRNQAVM